MHISRKMILWVSSDNTVSFIFYTLNGQLISLLQYLSISLRYLYEVFFSDFSKKWNNTYIVLNGSNLVFYKDQKAAQVVSAENTLTHEDV